MNCPICNRPGLSTEVSICPQCNSDLSQFHILNQLESRLLRWKRYSLFSSSFVLLSIIIAVIMIVSRNNTSRNLSLSQSSKSTDSLKIYRDGYLFTKARLDSLIVIGSAKPFIYYKVKKGDNLTKIAYMFYMDINRVKELASINSIANVNKLKENQILKIEITN